MLQKNSSCFFPCVHCDTSLVRQTPLKPNALTPCAGRGLRLRRPTPPPPPVPSKASESARISPFMTTEEEKERRRRWRRRTCFSSFHPRSKASPLLRFQKSVCTHFCLLSPSFRSDAGGGGGGGGIFRFDLGSEARHLGTEAGVRRQTTTSRSPQTIPSPLPKEKSRDRNHFTLDLIVSSLAYMRKYTQ